MPKLESLYFNKIHVGIEGPANIRWLASQANLDIIKRRLFSILDVRVRALGDSAIPLN